MTCQSCGGRGEDTMWIMADGGDAVRHKAESPIGVVLCARCSVRVLGRSTRLAARVLELAGGAKW